MSEKLFDRVGLIGIGLIGSSLARALRRDNPGASIVACARRAETLAAVRRLELADETTDDPAVAAAGADLVVIATPLSAFLRSGGAAFCLTLRLDRRPRPTLATAAA